VDAKGDIMMADSLESQKAAATFLVRTDKGEYIPDNRIGCDLGSFIGKRISKEDLVSMEERVRKNLTEFVASRSDIKVAAIPMSQDEVGVFVGLAGEFIDENGNIIETEPTLLSFTFPYLEGEPVPYTG